MASKEAGIKLTLTAAGFTSGLKKAESDLEKSANTMGGTLKKALSDGAKGGWNALSSTFGTIKSAVLSIGGLAGGIGAIDLVRGALKAESAYKKLAFNIKAGTGESVDFRDIQKEVQAQAIRTGIAAESLTQALIDVQKETGDQSFTRGSLATMATVAQGAREPIELIASLTGTLNEKFGVTNDQLGDTLASVISLGNKGGVSVEELAGRLGMIGATAKEAGLQGQQGFEKIVALLNLADNSTGSLRKGVAGVSSIFDKLGNATEKTKTLAKLGIDPSKVKGDITQTIAEITKATKGNKAKLETAFDGDALKILLDIGRQYADAYDKTAGDVKSKADAGLAAFNEAMQKAGTSSLKYSDLESESAKRQKDAQVQMNVAMEKLKAAFAAPEFVEAMKKIMGALPGLADHLVKFAAFAAESPWTAGAMGVAGIAGKGAMGAFSGTMYTGLEAAIKASFGIGAKTAATQVTSAVAAGGATAAEGIAAAAPLAGSAIAAAFGIAAAGAVAVAVGYAIGKMIKEHQDRAQAAQDAELDASPTGVVRNKNNTRALVWKRDEKGVLRSTEVSAEEADDYEAKMFNARNVGARRNPELDDPILANLPPAALARPPEAAAAPRRSAADAAMLAEMLAGRELKVRVINAKEIGGETIGAGSPTPGPAKR